MVEVAFLAALGIAIAALHYRSDFHSAFTHIGKTSARRPPSEYTPLRNYLLVLAAAVGAYMTARGASAALSSALPHKAKDNPSLKRATLALCVPVAAIALYLGAGSPPLGDHVAARWMARNWERNGVEDLAWCCRLFALLACWQVILAGLAMVCKTAANAFVSVAAPVGKAFGKGRTAGVGGDGDGGKDASGGGLEKHQQQEKLEGDWRNGAAEATDPRGSIASGTSSESDANAGVGTTSLDAFVDLQE